MKKNRFQSNCFVVDIVPLLAAEMERTGKVRTARAYLSTMRRLCGFAGQQLTFEQITPDLLMEFQVHLLQEGRTKNTVSFYMRNTRAIYNKAIALKLFKPCAGNLFEQVYTGNEKTVKRALSAKEMAKLGEPLQTSDGIPTHHSSLTTHHLDKAQLLFAFSFLCRGMSFVDVAYLKKSDLKNGVITYNRKKTGSLLQIKVTPKLQAIIDEFEPLTCDSEYLLPILFSYKETALRTQYESALRMQNARLKTLASLCGVEKTVSTHVARHTWATIAKQQNLPLSVISEGLGHNSERTTEIYLGALEQSVLDDANDKVCGVLKRAIH